MHNQDIKIIEAINSSEPISEETSFSLSKLCGVLLFSDEPSENERGRKILIHVLDNWTKVPNNHLQIWIDLVESAGFYPYIEKTELKEGENLSTSQFLRKIFHSSENLENTYFHEEQKHLSDLLESGKNIIVSAPTSFGKSLLIEDVVAGKKFKNIVIIQPTLALLDETRKKLKKYKDNYKIIVRTAQEPSKEKGNLFLLTAERVMEYRDLPKVDFFVIDEFYKLSSKRDDERSDVLNNAFNLLLKNKPQFYLLGPNIDAISPGFAEKYNAIFFKSSYSLVENQTIDIYTEHKDKFKHPRKNKSFIENTLFELLYSLRGEQTIIYCSSPERVRKIADKFAKFLDEKHYSKNELQELSLIEWLNDNISNEWSVSKCLKQGVGVHDGALPKHMTSSIIDYFNTQKLNFLFCTSTIIEGVNTSAKNIVYFDSKKGGKKVDYFDYSNIKGRSGRMMVHYVGKIYNFTKPPEKYDVVIDIPFYEQNPVSPEILIHLNENQVKKTDHLEYQNILNIPEQEKEIIRKNGLSVRGQQSIIEIFKSDIKSRPDLILWTGLPKYDQLEYLISIAWSNLLKPGESTSPFTEKQIAYITFDYGNNKSINHLINNQFTYFQTLAKYRDLTRSEVLDEAIRFSFQAMKHWFGYKIPKWLLTLNNLQQYVALCEGLNPGDYSFYAGQIENDFIQPNMIILNEFGVPRSAIDKFKTFIDPNWNEDQVMEEIQRRLLTSSQGLLKYEVEKITECL